MMGDLNMSNNFHEKLTNIQNKLKAPKTNYNSFSKFYYRSAEDILEAVKPLNAEHGIVLTLSDKPVLIGNWYYIEATAKVTDGKNELIVTAYARESETKKGMDSSQITGTASSYARKYALNGLYLIDDTKDADTDEYANRTQNSTNTETTKKVTEQEYTLLLSKANELADLHEMDKEKVYKSLKLDKNMTQIEFKASLKRAVDGIEKGRK